MPRIPAPRQILDPQLMRFMMQGQGGLPAAQDYLDKKNAEGLRLAIIGTNLAVFEEMPEAPAGPRTLTEDAPTKPA